MASPPVEFSEMKLKVAAVHASPVFMDKKATTAKVVRIIEDAGKQGIKLLGFPETFIPGYPKQYFIEAYKPPDIVNAISIYVKESVVCNEQDECIRSIQEACRVAGVAINLGVSERMPMSMTIFNSQISIDEDGGILSVHRKLMPTLPERMVWAQGDGSTMQVVEPKLGYRLGGLCCWENTMNGARQALADQFQHIHVGAWPALSVLRTFEAEADAQIEALMKTHALTAQVFVLSASNYVDQQCLDWMKNNIGEQSFVKNGGGWTAVIHPFCSFLAGPHSGSTEQLVTAELDFGTLPQVKVWIDAAGHYSRPEVLKFELNTESHWPNLPGPAPLTSSGQVLGVSPPLNEKEEEKRD